MDRDSAIRLRLGKLPSGLLNAYDEIYERIRNFEGSASMIAERAFQWVMRSLEPLSAELLVAAVCRDPQADATDQIDIEISHVLKFCKNLLVMIQNQTLVDSRIYRSRNILRRAA